MVRGSSVTEAGLASACDLLREAPIARAKPGQALHILAGAGHLPVPTWQHIRPDSTFRNPFGSCYPRGVKAMLVRAPATRRGRIIY